jgi:murein DD-endopeptidase MepM/ murein hydrolase activator NlpD
MDSKIHIHFFPRDPSRVRVISFSRALGLTLILTALPLCLLGFWLVLSGSLRENPARKLERQRMENENRVLRDKTASLQREAAALRQSLDSLESARIRALQATGLESPEGRSRGARASRFPFFHSGAGTRKPTSEGLARDLKQAREAALFFDSSLFVLSRNAAEVGRFPTAFPVDSDALIIRTFGPSSDPFTRRKSLHGGVDFSANPGAPVYASGGGRVLAAGQDPLWGYFVRLEHSDRVETFYAHLQQIRVHAGENVARGQVLGWIGQSGMATGPHLHFEMLLGGERVDPLRYLLPAEDSSGKPRAI